MSGTHQGFERWIRVPQPESVFDSLLPAPHVTMGHSCKVWACVGMCVLVSEDRSHTAIENTLE